MHAPNEDVRLSELLRDPHWRWPIVLTAGLWWLPLFMGLFVRSVPVLNPWPWLGVSMPLLLVPVAILCWRAWSGASAKPWPRWVFWLLAGFALSMAGLFVTTAWLNWRQGLAGQTLRLALMAPAMLSFLFIVRQLAHLHASDKDTL